MFVNVFYLVIKVIKTKNYHFIISQQNLFVNKKQNIDNILLYIFNNIFYFLTKFQINIDKFCFNDYNELKFGYRRIENAYIP